MKVAANPPVTKVVRYGDLQSGDLFRVPRLTGASAQDIWMKTTDRDVDIATGVVYPCEPVETIVEPVNGEFVEA